MFAPCFDECLNPFAIFDWFSMNILTHLLICILKTEMKQAVKEVKDNNDLGNYKSSDRLVSRMSARIKQKGLG